MQPSFNHLIFIILLTISLTIPTSDASDNQPSKQELFEHVFGNFAQLDASFHQKVLSATHGKRHYVDINSDAHPEEVWFIDTAPRHPERYRPLLVRVIDEDGDLHWNHEPDMDSDLYIADWKADGSVDAVLDYTDTDGDNDVDEVGMYFIGSGANYVPGQAMRVWWGKDIGDDNLLWYDIAYTYNQRLCQYRTHFGGNELFVSFLLDVDQNKWIPFFENPFLFYDHDRDGITEEVLRLSGYQDQVESMRYSFDADNDATDHQPRDFDVSISAWAKGSSASPPSNQRGRSDLRIATRYLDKTSLRSIPTGEFLAYNYARDFVKPIEWKTLLFTWDEIDLNVDAQNQYGDFDERWEGVIAHGNQDFPQVGGPSCGPHNKRYEHILQKSSTVNVYYHPGDHRIHLKHAERSWMDVDIDFNHTADMRYTMIDRDGNGYIDQYQFDRNGDGEYDDEWNVDDRHVMDIKWSWADINAIIATQRESLPLLSELVKLLKRSIKSIKPDLTLNLHEKFPPWYALDNLPESVMHRLKQSPESQRFRHECVKDYLITILHRLHDSESFWTKFNHNRSMGHYQQMMKCLEESFNTSSNLTEDKTSIPQTPRVAYTKRSGTTFIGWESEETAYWWSDGQFGFYGKNRPHLLYSQKDSLNREDYRDVFNVKNSPGCGGMTLYINDTPYPVWNQKDTTDIQFSSRLLNKNDNAVTVELKAEGIGQSSNPYTITWHATSMAEQPETQINVMVDGGNQDDTLALGIGLAAFEQEAFHIDTQAGVMAEWGIQNPDMGWIGMGVIFPPHRFMRIENLPGENQVIIAVEPQLWTEYSIQCEWLRGRRFNRNPSAHDWFKQLGQLSAQLKKEKGE